MSAVLSSMDWGPVLGVLGTIVTGLLTWLANSIKARNEAAANASRAQSAELKLAAIGISLLQRAWAEIGPQVQGALADGKLDQTERDAVEAAVKKLVNEVTDSATLEEIGAALGLPLPGLIAKLAATLIDRWTAAHDPAVPTASRLAYPVAQPDLSGPGYENG